MDLFEYSHAHAQVRYHVHVHRRTLDGRISISRYNIWDSARRLEDDMYRPGMMQCLSFGHNKPLQIGHGGAILLDDKEAYGFLLQQRYDGRDLSVTPWQEQRVFKVGYHYRPSIEDARIGLEKLYSAGGPPKYHDYPDLRDIQIIGDT
jgi:hypothetical protein